MATQTHWKKVFSSEYLGSCDLDEGKDLKAIIKKVEIQKVKNTQGESHECNVAIFTDPKIKPMILNATNCKVVKKFAKTPYIEGWVNIPIQIYSKDGIKAFGEITEGLRIRETQPVMTKPELIPANKAVWDNAIKYYKENKKLDGIKDRYTISVENEKLLISEAAK